MTILCTGDSLNALMDGICKNNADSVTVWECFSKDKITLSITGRVATNTSVKIYERYDYNNEYVFVEKIANYANNEWAFDVVEIIRH